MKKPRWIKIFSFVALGIMLFVLGLLEHNAYNPKYSFVLSKLAGEYAGKDQLSRSQRYYLRAIRLDPSNAEAHYGLGQLYHKKGHYLRASESFNAAIDLKPDFDQAFFGLAQVYSQQGNYGKAARYIERAKLIPGSYHRQPLYWFRFGLIHAKLGNKRESLGALDYLKENNEWDLAKELAQVINQGAD